MNEFKSIYDFTITEKIQKPVEEVNTVDGKKVKTITDQEVESPVKIYFKKPSRRDEESADLFYSVEMSNFVKKGLLTRAMLLKKYQDLGGLMSEESQKEREEAYGKLLKTQEEFQELKALSKPTKKNKEKIDKLTAEFAATRQRIIDLESAHNSLLENTADRKAEGSLLRWYALNFTYIQREDDDKPVPYFDGEDFEDKLQDYYDKEDSEDDFYRQVARKIGAAIAIWIHNKETSSKEISELVQEADSIE